MHQLSLEFEVSTSVNHINSDGFLFIHLIEDPKEGENKSQKVNQKESHKESSKSRKNNWTKELPDWIRGDVEPIARKRNFEPKAGATLSFDSSDGTRKSVICLSKTASMFELLTLARKSLSAIALDCNVQRLSVGLTSADHLAENMADALISAAGAALYKFPKYVRRNKNDLESNIPVSKLFFNFVVEESKVESVSKRCRHARNLCLDGTNIVRWLSKRAGNDLTCKAYVDYTRKMAKDNGWIFKHIDHRQLEDMNAGAFLAVVKGSSHEDYGIVELSYEPEKQIGKQKNKSKKSSRNLQDQHIVLVGKGLVFDTGGYCLKPSAHMFGMHGDMAGSAVALALLNIASKEQWPIKITAYLAIADNMVGPRAYKPNDVVTSMKGTTIEIIDTDAEGRMVLADTLYLAAKRKPTLIMDFATLTGCCVRAIGTTYSGVFTNRPELNDQLIAAGKESGERVWPFPMDSDFAECLESTVADIKQCREKAGVDHIEAAQFLMHFVGLATPWVHVDLSSIENAGGLGHVATDEIGFGVRFASRFLQSLVKGP